MGTDRLHRVDHADSRLRALRHIRRVGGVAQVELAQAIGLTKGTMSHLVGDLLRQGMLKEETSASTGRGRPRVTLTINRQAAYAIGFFPMRDGTATVEILDLEGTSVFSQKVAFDVPPLDQLVDLLGDTLEAAMDHAPVARDTIRAIGLVLPAHLDRDRGVIHWMPRHGHTPLAVSAPLAARLGMPVSLENRATVLARAEHWFGQTETADDFTMIALMDAGMGAACYVAGQLQSGFHGMNNEFGHVPIAFEGGRPCHCGGRGCLAAYATVHAIATMITEQSEKPSARLDSVKVFQVALADAQRGDSAALAMFERAGRALAAGIAGHINAHDPGRVVVAFMFEGFMHLLEPVVRAALKGQVLPALEPRTIIEFRVAMHEGLLRGTAALALEQLYRFA